MKITITDGQNIINLDVDPNEEIQNVKALIQAETSIPSEKQILTCDGKQLRDKNKLNQLSINENSMIFLRVGVVNKQIATNNRPKLGIADMIKNFDKNVKNSISQFDIPKRSLGEFKAESQRIRLQISNDKQRLLQIQKSDPQIAAAIKAQNSNVLAELLMKKHDAKIQKFVSEEKRFMELSKDPMNAEYQRMLQERIHQENIQKNYEFANQYIPEVFGNVTMLYINASINKYPIQAFVDSGAQSTIMSEQLANKCGLMRLVDKRMAGVAVGVGTCKILGKIHAAEIEIQKKLITCSFTVIENNGVDFLLGLDMLRRFSCCIDLKANTLNFQDGLIVTRFLDEGEIQKKKKIQEQQNLQPKLAKLMGMGFSKEECLAALKNTDNNDQLAASILMQRKFGK